MRSSSLPTSPVPTRPIARVAFRRAVADSRGRIRGTKGLFFKLMFLLVLVSGLTGVLRAWLLPPSPSLDVLIDVAAGVVLAPLGATLSLAALDRVVGGATPIEDLLLRAASSWIPYGVLAAIEGALGYLAFFLLGPVGLVLGWLAVPLLAFAPLLVLDRGLVPIEALAWSVGASARRPLLVLKWLGVKAIVVVLVVATLGVAGIWLVPFQLLLAATLYGQVFGIEGGPHPSGVRGPRAVQGPSA